MLLRDVFGIFGKILYLKVQKKRKKENTHHQGIILFSNHLEIKKVYNFFQQAKWWKGKFSIFLLKKMLCFNEGDKNSEVDYPSTKIEIKMIPLVQNIQESFRKFDASYNSIANTKQDDLKKKTAGFYINNIRVGEYYTFCHDGEFCCLKRIKILTNKISEDKSYDNIYLTKTIKNKSIHNNFHTSRQIQKIYSFEVMYGQIDGPSLENFEVILLLVDVQLWKKKSLYYIREKSFYSASSCFFFLVNYIFFIIRLFVAKKRKTFTI